MTPDSTSDQTPTPNPITPDPMALGLKTSTLGTSGDFQSSPQHAQPVLASQRLQTPQDLLNRPSDASTSQINGRGADRGMSLGITTMVDLLAGMGVGAGLGWLLDTWLGWQPFGLVVGLVLGFIGGVRNVVVHEQRYRERTQSPKQPHRDP